MLFQTRKAQLQAAAQKCRNFYHEIKSKGRPDWQRCSASLDANMPDSSTQLPAYLPLLLFQTSLHNPLTGQKIHLQFLPFLVTRTYYYQIPMQLINVFDSIQLTAKITAVKTLSPQLQQLTVEYDHDPQSLKLWKDPAIPSNLFPPSYFPKLTEWKPKIIQQFNTILSSGRLQLLYNRTPFPDNTTFQGNGKYFQGVVEQALGNVFGQATALYYPPYYHGGKHLRYLIDQKQQQIGFTALTCPSFQDFYRLRQKYTATGSSRFEQPFLSYVFERFSSNHAHLGIFQLTIKAERIFFEPGEETPPDDQAIHPTENDRYVIVCGELHSRSFPDERDGCTPVDPRESSACLFKLFNLVVITHWRDPDGQEHAAIRYLIGDQTPYTGSFPFVEE